ncbi:prolyl oligopeptidase family serine peptidase [Paracoccus sp. SCSIO 75233]|uniref:alpha/beta hydrolase family protein n=1 Tax=Paracoccus sp. SCSIO 75233 TaxID=3017782 RepID=UPI0022F0DF8D|nr:prolyl oligopeptidase family serine peptidase [Paracoccus sp. SCSIO 75233]WBU53638.1 prolyl oligopeptidase family serine peptidase [Paracoccus sp. SCSIO 75233]
MSHKITFAAACLFATSAATLAEDYKTGLVPVSVADAERPLEGFVWYPTLSGETPKELLGNQVWQGIEAVEAAEAASGAFPLVVMSHGMYGNAQNQAWLGAELSRRGYVVAAISHPGTSTWARDPDDARELWERPRDISRLIDYLLENAPAEIDAERIMATGHSLGGYTVVALAGGRFDPVQFDAFCEGQENELVCGIMDDWNVAKTPQDREEITQDLSDPRIDAFAVFDLGGTQAFSAESLAAIEKPMLVFGAPRDVAGTALDLDVESRALVARLPKGNVTYLEPETLSHFDFLGECTEQGLDILKEEEPEDMFVCEDGIAERRSDHAMILTEVLRFFAEQ